MNAKSGKSPRNQWIGIGIVGAVVLAVVAVVVIGKDGDNGPSAEESKAQLCALRDSSDKPLVDPNASTTRDDLATSVRDRAAALTAAADASSGEAADALRASAAAMTRVADAIAADTSGKSLADVVAELASDKDLQDSTATLQKVLSEQCS